MTPPAGSSQSNSEACCAKNPRSRFRLDQDTTDLALVNRNTEKLRVAMTKQRQHGIVRRELGPGRSAALWSVVG